MSQPLQIAAHACFSSRQIAARRRAIRHHLIDLSRTIRDDNFTEICLDDLRQLFDAYDEHFFENAFKREFEQLSNRLAFRLSKRMTHVGGTTSYEKVIGKRKFEIAISTALIFSNWHAPGPAVRVGGLPTTSRLDALQRIFEHELVHLLELFLWDESRCGGSRFKSIVRRLFGHLESNHQLVSPAEFVQRQFGIRIGDPVEFEFRGHRLRGLVNGVLQRVTVLVAHAHGERYRDGKRYLRYYVPPDQLVLLEHLTGSPRVSNGYEAPQKNI